MEYSAMEQYWIWLAGVEGVTPKRFYQLLAQYGDARAVWDGVADIDEALLPEKVRANLRAARSEEALYRLFGALEKAGIQCVTRLSAHYPASLASVADPPPMLYVKGCVDFSFPRAIAVVGTRHATRDGLRAGYEMSKALASHDVAIVSGMARGIDTKAHEGCLDAGGRTVAVLGCGVDCVYPPENDGLYKRILDSGGSVVSEYPPGTKPLPPNFPSRNRIISGMSDGVLLVEAGKSSGGLITTDYATEQGRDVFVVPGSIYSTNCVGSNALLRDCAAPALSEWDILEYYRWAERGRAKREAPKAPLAPEEETVVDMLRREEMSFDELAVRTGFNTAKLNSLLTILELRGIIKQASGKLFRAY